MVILAAACVAAAVAWAYLLAGHGGFWRTDVRLPGRAGEPGPRPWPSVVAVVPARDEAAILPETLPTLLAQDYPGPCSVVLVDDASTDGTAAVAAAVSSGAVSIRPGAAESAWAESTPAVPVRAESTPAVPVRAAAAESTEAGLIRATAAGAAPAGVPLRVVSGGSPPAGWAGKVWAMAQGVAAARECDYLLFTDADIALEAGVVTDLVRAAAADDRALVSQMALLRCETGWERWIVPTFVYFFAQLYPFRRVGRPRARTAAAAGGCMLVRRQTLAAAGGLERIAGARIDDVALARLLKRGPARARCWLGFTTSVHSRRPYPGLGGLWDMVARSAYTQLRYSPALLAGTVAGLGWLYLLPPVATLGGLAGAAAGGHPVGPAVWWWCAGAGLAGWALMTLSYLPVLRLYRLSPLRAPCLPVIALLYTAMTVDSARRHRRGRGGEWKGRAVPASAPPG
ncbi:MAG TPA: glycosyltransferase [Streptosporangiaceae bacterium]|nr:glycosyltransferase [Streptosporangiaceae bacterium]